MPDAQIKAVITAEDRASGTLAKVKGEIEGVGNSASKFLGDAMGQATTIATVGIAALTGAAILSVKAFNESEQAIAQTNAVLASTKNAAGVTAIEVTKLATALEKTTKFSDEDVRSVENLLLTFTSIGKDIFPQATKTVLDMATALGEDTKSASIQLGKALQDPVLGITALRRVGVNFSDAQKDVIKNLVETGQKAKAQQLILKELTTEFGGSAEAAGKTFAGSLAKLKNSLNNVEEGVGYMISQALVPLVQHFTEVVNAVDWEKVMGIIGDAFITAADKIQKFFKPIVAFLDRHKAILIDFMQKFGETGLVVIPILAALSVAIGLLTSPLFLIIAALTVGWELWEKHRVLFLALTVVLGPLTLAFIALRAALMFQEVVAGLNVAIVALTGTDIAATFAAEGLGAALIATAAAAALPITLVVVGVATIWAAVTAINALKDAWNKEAASERAADDTYNNMVRDARAQYAAGKISKARLDAVTSMRAEGGPVSSNSPYIVGEKGPELFIPSNSGTIIPNNKLGGMPSSGGASINITIQAGAFMGSQIEARKFAEQIVGHINDVAGKKNMTGAQLLGSS